MIFIGAQSCDYQSFGQIYVRQLGGKLHLGHGGRVSSKVSKFMDGVIIRRNRSDFIITRAKLLRMVIVAELITMIG